MINPSTTMQINRGNSKYSSWISVAGCLPTVDIQVQRQCFGGEFGVYSICTAILSPVSVLYSFGVGKDISFEKELHQIVPLEIHLFDPTPASILWAQAQYLPDQFHFHPYGISNQDGQISIYPPKNSNRTSHSIIKHKWAADNSITVPAKSLTSIVNELNHQPIDVLKMDIEGAEYAVIDEMINHNIRPTQIIVEFHHHYPEIGIPKTLKAIQQLHQLGYKLFFYSTALEEFSFIFDNHSFKEIVP